MASVYAADSSTHTLTPTMLAYAKSIYNRKEADIGPGEGFNDFLTRLTSPALDALLPETVDANHSLANYYISSSHNTYLAGNQLYGKASTRPYQHVKQVHPVRARPKD